MVPGSSAARTWLRAWRAGSAMMSARARLSRADTAPGTAMTRSPAAPGRRCRAGCPRWPPWPRRGPELTQSLQVQVRPGLAGDTDHSHHEGEITGQAQAAQIVPDPVRVVVRGHRAGHAQAGGTAQPGLDARPGRQLRAQLLVAAQPPGRHSSLIERAGSAGTQLVNHPRPRAAMPRPLLPVARVLSQGDRPPRGSELLPPRPAVSLLAVHDQPAKVPDQGLDCRLPDGASAHADMMTRLAPCVSMADLLADYRSVFRQQDGMCLGLAFSRLR